MEAVSDQVGLFNSPLETGLRLVVVLEQLYPRSCGVSELVWFDYLAVHSASAGGPSSLHPDLPGSSGELVVRRGIVEKGLRLMQRVHLIDELHTSSGINFTASEDAPSFVEALQSSYFKQLKDRGTWIAQEFRQSSVAEIQERLRTQAGWNVQFTFPTSNRTAG